MKVSSGFHFVRVKILTVHNQKKIKYKQFTNWIKFFQKKEEKSEVLDRGLKTEKQFTTVISVQIEDKLEVPIFEDAMNGYK